MMMTHDSYVLKYFKAQKNDLRVGPPVYFVVGGKFDYSDNFHQEVICGTSYCSENSLFNQISQASHEPESSYIVDSPASWLDDYFGWADTSSCCRLFKNDTNIFCPSTLTDINRNNECKKCQLKGDDEMINSAQFYKFLPEYLSDIPTTSCPKAGRAAYGSSVKLDMNNNVLASHYSSYHSPLVKSSDFIEAMKSARFLASNIERAVSTALKPGEEVKVFPYSLVYVYYEQYLTIYGDSIRSLALSITAIFLVSFVLYGFDIKASLIVVFTTIVFYFRMYFGIVIIGALHGLVLLPVLLSVFGGKPKLGSSLKRNEM